MSTLALEITVRDLMAYADEGTPHMVLDVREPNETQAQPFEGAVEIPMNAVPARQNELPRDKTIVVSCHLGGRSMQVVQFLRQAGFDNVTNLEGGIVAWLGRDQ